jgi:hypothetical protein
MYIRKILVINKYSIISAHFILRNSWTKTLRLTIFDSVGIHIHKVVTISKQYHYFSTTYFKIYPKKESALLLVIYENKIIYHFVFLYYGALLDVMLYCRKTYFVAGARGCG